ncbi:MAG: alpha/beta hydrolase [Gammaproteobacteria bacterium]|uniref:alpha/beta hydrolase n=1 Tax=Limnobacter sp. TaxID=2003368 RepID=UPI001DEC5BBD|nr:alpha/beta fold hydrolase [Limnobacter sp.]MBU0783306.1 alpha/beta hydrolase [Gammaproteobacteria bacterium]MBU0850525.1 alpha/beta hydrolase [Gammaproteobacteria bacterium]MBU1268319.1 alpha/beta hydrolase [Gammaproteobacteria bacterium]MBU1530163.1 alpha/beta hydrolase [Gammaproteobacteria bacterium]MBU1780537.1 alpha/beta hydrolase [Gammaproteobacteria bacterium]
MPKEHFTFNQLANPAPKSGLAGVWSAPQAMLDLGGNVAVWAEQGSTQALAPNLRPCPWLVLHGGPGGSLGASHVAPLRFASVPWFGFDQRNSGLSEDLDLGVIDLQRYVDDALDVADRLDISQFHILGGSWGATLALAIAAYRPQRVASVVLRAPFVPLRPRVDAFFESLERLAPDYFAEHFGPGARTDLVCECFDVATPEHLLELSIAWSKLETTLLTGKPGQLENGKSFLTDVQELALVRKYRLQAHFLKHDCFLSPADWNALVSRCAHAKWPLSIVQGLSDSVCPPGGSRMLSEMLLRSTLVELPQTGHLAETGNMMTAISEQVARHEQLARTD